MSEVLKEFLSEWHQWATQQKVEETRHFMKNEGLCPCLNSWAVWFKHDYVALRCELVEKLEADFKGNYQFPFDKNLTNYWQAKTQNRMHENPQRLAWVKTQIG